MICLRFNKLLNFIVKYQFVPFVNTSFFLLCNLISIIILKDVLVFNVISFFFDLSMMSLFWNENIIKLYLSVCTCDNCNIWSAMSTILRIWTSHRPICFNLKSMRLCVRSFIHITKLYSNFPFSRIFLNRAFSVIFMSCLLLNV